MSNGETKTGQERQSNGQYGSTFEAVCKCGHTLGQHTAARPYSCIECDEAELPECCAFKKAKVTK